MLTMAFVGLSPIAKAYAQDPATEQQPASTPSEPVTVTVVFMAVATERDQAELNAEFQRQFPEFAEALGQCRFTNCHHVAEPGCAILEAVDGHRISKARHGLYLQLRHESLQKIGFR